MPTCACADHRRRPPGRRNHCAVWACTLSLYNSPYFLSVFSALMKASFAETHPSLPTSLPRSVSAPLPSSSSTPPRSSLPPASSSPQLSPSVTIHQSSFPTPIPETASQSSTQISDASGMLTNADRPLQRFLTVCSRGLASAGYNSSSVPSSYSVNVKKTLCLLKKVVLPICVPCALC